MNLYALSNDCYYNQNMPELKVTLPHVLKSHLHLDSLLTNIVILSWMVNFGLNKTTWSWNFQLKKKNQLKKKEKKVFSKFDVSRFLPQYVYSKSYKSVFFFHQHPSTKYVRLIKYSGASVISVTFLEFKFLWPDKKICKILFRASTDILLY